MDIVSLLILRALSGGGGETPVATDISYDNTTSGLSAENVQNALDELSSEKLNTSEKGSAGGVAELNENGIILTSQLPSYVDDVLEFPTLNDFPAQGESGKIYVDLSTNRTYRWGGSSYTEISPSLALGETSSTAYRGDRGKVAYDHSQLKTGNPHNVTKAQIGLGNVDNTSDANKPISTATQAALDTKLSEDDLYNMIEDSTVSGNPVTLRTLAKTNAKSAKVTMLPIQSGSGDPSPTNIRPISGRDSVVLNVSGKNICNTANAEIGTAWNGGSNSARARLIIPCNPSTTYTFSRNASLTVSNMYVALTPTIPASSAGIEYTNITTKTFTTGASDKYIVLAFSQTAITQTNIDDMLLQIELGETASSYEAFDGETHTATFPSTVYGGEYEFVSGKLIITNKKIAINPNNLLYGGEDVYYIETNDMKSGNALDELCDTFKTVLNSTYYGVRFGANNANIFFYKLNENIESVSDLASAKQWFADNTVNVCYELATPIEITLTPETISLLKDSNVITTDGDNAEIVYTELDLTELPDVTSADEGKVLTVNSSGEWVAQTLPDGTNISY